MFGIQSQLQWQFARDKTSINTLMQIMSGHVIHKGMEQPTPEMPSPRTKGFRKGNDLEPPAMPPDDFQVGRMEMMKGQVPDQHATAQPTQRFNKVTRHPVDVTVK